MYKRFLIAVLTAVIIATVAGCSPHPAESYTPENTPEAAPVTDAPIDFYGEAEFRTAIWESREKRAAGEQMNGDFSALADITEYYRLINLPEGFFLDSIRPNRFNVTIEYRDKNRMHISFGWTRMDLVSWEEDISGIKARKELTHNGIEYVFAEYVNPETDEPWVVGLRWFKDNKMFGLSAPSGYSLEEMLDLSEYETILMDTEDDGSHVSQNSPFREGPIFLSSEEEFNAAVREARKLKAATELMSDIRSLLAETTEYYRPINLPEGFSLDEILFFPAGVSFTYRDENLMIIRFTCYPEKDPATWRTSVWYPGAKSEQELNHNGIEYVLVELAVYEPGEPAGYELCWFKDGNLFKASIPLGYTVEEMLDFSDYETVPVDAEPNC